MTCICGHGKAAHGTTGWPRFEPICDTRICCDAKRRGHPGGPDGHDFVSHPSEWCQCKGFQPTEGETK